MLKNNEKAKEVKGASSCSYLEGWDKKSLDLKKVEPTWASE